MTGGRWLSRATGAGKRRIAVNLLTRIGEAGQLRRRFTIVTGMLPAI